MIIKQVQIIIIIRLITTFPSEASLIASQMIPYKQLLLSSASLPPFNINPLPYDKDNNDDDDDDKNHNDDDDNVVLLQSLITYL
jgi:hypothetical protein